MLSGDWHLGAAVGGRLAFMMVQLWLRDQVNGSILWGRPCVQPVPPCHLAFPNPWSVLAFPGFVPWAALAVLGRCAHSPARMAADVQQPVREAGATWLTRHALQHPGLRSVARLPPCKARGGEWPVPGPGAAGVA